MNTNRPDLLPTAILPPAPAVDPLVKLANRVRQLAEDIRNGRISEADSVMIGAMLRIVGA